MLFISPPFGNYINLPGTISIKGSFTLNERPGKWVQIFKTLRYSFKYNGWCNKIGLRNPGIDYAIKNYKKNSIVSVAILDKKEIKPLLNKIPEDMNIELNISCPNTKEDMVKDEIQQFINPKREWCIVKLSPLITKEEIDELYNSGFRQFNCSNTLPTKTLQTNLIGGLSGIMLIPYTINTVKYIRNNYPDTIIIAGGGVRNWDIGNLYLNLGANHVSVSTLCFSPIKFSFFYGKYIFNKLF